ncbi:unnamed protein product [Cyclocybe aegerita]|uniref:Uncharacterized protein n=1 Tax=Cyclocybe aegerita TaxID=1973307 RepID=A0A8S0X2F5_CYCAE|nr:unnamed protein product [Cyclocybe aegerita]
MLSLFSFLGRLRQSISGVDEPPRPQPDESVDEPPRLTADGLIRPQTIDSESSVPDARPHSPSTVVLVTLNAPEVSSYPPPVDSIPTTDPESSGQDVSWSPSPSILAFPTPNASVISLAAPSVPSGSVAINPRDWPEVFVDASGSGIGIILNKRWLAWTFTPNHPLIPLGRNNSVVSSWSELIAVELGLLTILAAGYRDITIKLKSDNRGVIKAIAKKRWSPRHELDVILQRILSLSEDNGLTLKVGWILGLRNPADKPSRGKYPPREMMLDCCPDVPHYLDGMIQPVDPSSLRN